MRHGHRHIVFITGLNDIVIADRATGLGDVGYATLVSTLDVIAKREEGIGAKGNIFLRCQPGLLFFFGEYGRLLGEDTFPVISTKQIHVFIANVDVNGIIAVRAADIPARGEVALNR